MDNQEKMENGLSLSPSILSHNEKLDYQWGLL